jgi:hypothetical protein
MLSNFIRDITLTPPFPEGVKKSLFHPHPFPPPLRGRQFLVYFNMFTLSPRGRGEGEGGETSPPVNFYNAK